MRCQAGVGSEFLHAGEPADQSFAIAHVNLLRSLVQNLLIAAYDVVKNGIEIGQLDIADNHSRKIGQISAPNQGPSGSAWGRYRRHAPRSRGFLHALLVLLCHKAVICICCEHPINESAKRTAETARCLPREPGASGGTFRPDRAVEGILHGFAVAGRTEEH